MSVDRLIVSKIDIANIALFKGNFFIIELRWPRASPRANRIKLAIISPEKNEKVVRWVLGSRWSRTQFAATCRELRSNHLFIYSRMHSASGRMLQAGSLCSPEFSFSV